MKKRLAFLMITSFCCFAAVNAQMYISGHYSFTYPENFIGIETVAASFNGYWNAFNEIFRFDPSPELHINNVVILADKTAYDAYITERIGEKRSEYLFLKYPKPELSELVLYVDSGSVAPALPFSGPALNRQLFLQYIYSYVLEPPLWIREGFQSYFEMLSYDPATGNMSGDGYSPWLETAKNMHADSSRKIDTLSLLSSVTGTYESARFYPQAWSFVSFLMNTEKSEYQRFLSDSCLLLEGKASFNGESQQVNTEIVTSRFLRFNTSEKSDVDFSQWLSTQYTFAELMQAGVSLYNEGKYSESRAKLLLALKTRPTDPLLFYYMGLVVYAEKEYKNAEIWYRKALEFGAESSTVNWALGLNAYADKRYTESRVYLETAKAQNGLRYAEKVGRLISSMPK